MGCRVRKMSLEVDPSHDGPENGADYYAESEDASGRACELDTASC